MMATPPAAGPAQTRHLHNNHLHHRTSLAAATSTQQPSAKKRAPLSRRSTDRSMTTTTKGKRRSGEYHRAPSAASSQRPEADDDDDELGNSFSQFCATCEVQIVVPSTSILYCSEKCRRKDCGMSPPASPSLKDASSHARPEDDIDIIPPLSPTIRKPTTFGTTPTASDFSISAAAAPSDSSSSRPSFDRSTSEAARYLNQFHNGERPRSWRPRSNRQSAVPSLSHSPSSTASSSVPQYSTTGPSHSSRPLPMSRGLVSKSVDLVTPSAAAGQTSPDSMDTLTARASSLQLESRLGLEDEEDLFVGARDYDDDEEEDKREAPGSYYEKRTYDERRMSTAQSSLKQLLHPGARDKH